RECKLHGRTRNGVHREKVSRIREQAILRARNVPNQMPKKEPIIEVLLFRYGTRDSGLDLSFDITASSECMSGLARASSVEALLLKYPLFPFSLLIMAKKDMDTYHSRLTYDDLNDRIARYNIPCDLHPQLPPREFVMFKLPKLNVIGVYHRIFDFFGVRIPFLSFLLSLIKHYNVHFSQLGPLGLKKVVTFEMLCRSLQDESTINLFRVFQTLCKQGHWFSFAKRRAPSPVCIDDNRHPNSAIDDPKPPVVMGIHDFFYLLEWTRTEVQEELHHDIRPTLPRLPFYCTPPATADVGIPDLTLEDLAAGTPSAKVMDKANSSKKWKALLSRAASSHVAKRTRSVVARSSGSTT
ncbi:hypothetical protein Tco_1117266, partial [Tanacetum coccineum]